MKKSLNLMGVGVIMLCSQVAFAQASFDRQIADVSLLQVKEVKNELKVTDAQRARMNKHAEEFNKIGKEIRTKYEKANQKPTQADMTKFGKAQSTLREKVLNELTPAQVTRLREITLQDAGIPALADNIIGKKIGLSGTQTTRVRSLLKSGAERSAKIMKRMEDKLAKDFKNKKPKNEAESKKLKAQFDSRFESEMGKIRPSLQKIELEIRKGIFNTLSVRQRKSWDSLLGKPMKPAN